MDSGASLTEAEGERESGILNWAFAIPEIRKLIFQNMNLEQAKMCRYVCLEWCKEVTFALRPRTTTRVTSERCFDLERVIKVIEESRRTRVPSLFQRMSLFVQLYPVPWRLEFLQVLITRATVPITKLTLDNPPQDGPSSCSMLIASVIENCCLTLTHLKTKGWPIMYLFSSSSPRRVHFPNLKALMVFGQDDDHHFFGKIIALAPKLKFLSTTGDIGTLKLLEKACLKGIESLEMLRISPESQSRVVEELKRVKVDKLLHLMLDWQSDRGLHDVLFRFSSSLKSLRIETKCSIFPFCPNLTHLTLKEPQLDELDLSTLPSLMSIHFYDLYKQIHKDQVQMKPTANITEVSLVPPRLCHRELTLTRLFQRFPNATYWKIHFMDLSSFCQLAETRGVSVEKLQVYIDVRISCPNGEERGKRELMAFSKLHLLTKLHHLELYHDGNFSNYRPNVDIRNIELGRLSSLRSLKIYSATLEPGEDLLKITHLKVDIVLFLNPTQLRWCHELNCMPNVTVTQVSRSLFSDRFSYLKDPWMLVSS